MQGFEDWARQFTLYLQRNLISLQAMMFMEPQ